MDWEMTLRNEREKGREKKAVWKSGLRQRSSGSVRRMRKSARRLRKKESGNWRSRLHCWKRETIDQRYARVNAMNDKKSVIHHK